MMNQLTKETEKEEDHTYVYQHKHAFQSIFAHRLLPKLRGGLFLTTITGATPTVIGWIAAGNTSMAQWRIGPTHLQGGDESQPLKLWVSCSR